MIHPSRNRFVTHFSNYISILAVVLLCMLTLSQCGHFEAENDPVNSTKSVCTHDSVYERICKKMPVYFSYDEVMNASTKQNKKTLIIFNSIACVICRDFEEDVLFNEEVKETINSNYLLAVLFVDDRTQLPQHKFRRSRITGSEITSIGQYNCELQIMISQYGSNPVAVILDSNGNLLSRYDEKYNPNSFNQWLIKSNQ